MPSPHREGGRDGKREGESERRRKRERERGRKRTRKRKRKRNLRLEKDLPPTRSSLIQAGSSGGKCFTHPRGPSQLLAKRSNQGALSALCNTMPCATHSDAAPL